jgi:hypothetical protein
MPEVAAPAAGTTTTPPADTMADFRKLLNEVTSSAAGGTALSERETKLLRENYKVREKVRELTGQLETATKKVTPEGATVLTGDDAKAWIAFKALGKKPEELTTVLTEHGTLTQEKAQREAQAALDDVAQSLGITNVRAFKRLIAAEGLTVSTKTVKVKDEESGRMVDEQVPVVLKRGAKEGTEPEPLADVLERDFAEDIPTLLAESVSDDLDAGTTTEETRPARVLGASRTGTSGSGGSQDDAATGGTRFPRIGSREPTGANQQRKRDGDAIAAKAATGRYSL